MVCPECLTTTRRGKLLCQNCLEELKAKKAKAKAKAAAAPEEGEAEEEEFPIPEALPRPQPRPWVASLLLGAVGILVSLLFYVLADAVHVSVFILAVLGFVWGLVGLFGPHEQKPQALAGIVLNVVPFVLAAMLGLDAPWIEREQDIEAQQIEQMTEEEKADMRIQQRREIIRQYQQRMQR